MSEVVPLFPKLPKSSVHSIEKVDELAGAIASELPAYAFITEHVLHGGMYTRSLRLPPGIVAAAVLVKPPTMLITVGSLEVWSNDEVLRVTGYNVIPGSAGRKIAFATYSEVAMSMVFPCRATTVEQAQQEFTEEHERLVPLSLPDRHIILITGE